MAGVGVVVEGEFVAIGTIPTSSERSEGDAGGRVSAEESGVALRRVTAPKLVWAETGKVNISVINKKAPQKGGLFLRSEI